LGQAHDVILRWAIEQARACNVSDLALAGSADVEQLEGALVQLGLELPHGYASHLRRLVGVADFEGFALGGVHGIDVRPVFATSAAPTDQQGNRASVDLDVLRSPWTDRERMIVTGVDF